MSHLFTHLCLIPDGLVRHICGTYLLGDPACFTILDVRPPQFIQNFGFSCVDMAKDTNHWGPENICGAILFILLSSFLENNVRNEMRFLFYFIRIYCNL
jgi:hypothetical protein